VAYLRGTSESSPIFAGIVALADQKAGHRLGDINGALYLLGLGSTLAAPAAYRLVDVTVGDNSFDGVTGFPARPRLRHEHRLGHDRRRRVRAGPGPAVALLPAGADPGPRRRVPDGPLGSPPAVRRLRQPALNLRCQPAANSSANPLPTSSCPDSMMQR